MVASLATRTLSDNRVVRYWPRGASAALFKEHGPEAVIAGPAGCIAGETRIYDPTTGDAAPIVDLYRAGIAPTVLTLLGPVKATVPFRKGVAQLYRVRLSSGRECVVTEDHRLLRSDGWTFVRDLHAGDVVLASLPNPPVSNSGAALLTSPRDDDHLTQILRGSTDRCADDCRPYDARSLSAPSSDQVHAPSQGDVRGHNRVDRHGGGRLPLSARTHLGRSPARLAMPDYSDRSVGMVRMGSDGGRGTWQLSDALSRHDGPSPTATIPLLHIPESLPRADSMANRLVRRSVECHASAETTELEQPSLRVPPPFVARSFAPDTRREAAPFGLPSDAYSLSCPTSKSNYTAQWDTVSTIQYERTDEYYDLHVPGAEHYLAEGIWHHNTGKTYGCLWRLHLAALKYPGMRGIMLRKVQEDLTASALVTYQERVLGAGSWGVRPFGGSKLKPAGFQYPNGSGLLIGGLDKAEKVMSREYDLVYVNESTELDAEDWENLTTRTRWGVMPYQQVYGDCNPQGPGHWLYLRHISGTLPLLTSVHEDNPDLYDGDGWTARGQAYLAQLDNLTGFRRDRLRLGLWVAAEGVVYPAFNRATHVTVVDTEDWAAALGIDFGAAHPTVILDVRYAGERLHIARELYRPMDADQLFDAVTETYHSAGAVFAVADPSRKDHIDALNRRGLRVRRGKNDIIPGINRVTAKLPHLTVDPSCVNTIREFESYHYPKNGSRDQPVKEDDHAMDALRYLVMALTSTPKAVAARGIPQESKWR